MSPVTAMPMLTGMDTRCHGTLMVGFHNSPFRCVDRRLSYHHEAAPGILRVLDLPANLEISGLRAYYQLYAL